MGFGGISGPERVLAIIISAGVFVYMVSPVNVAGIGGAVGFSAGVYDCVPKVVCLRVGGDWI